MLKYLYITILTDTGDFCGESIVRLNGLGLCGAGGLVHPRTRVEGPAGDKFLRQQGRRIRWEGPEWSVAERSPPGTP